MTSPAGNTIISCPLNSALTGDLSLMLSRDFIKSFFTTTTFMVWVPAVNRKKILPETLAKRFKVSVFSISVLFMVLLEHERAHVSSRARYLTIFGGRGSIVHPLKPRGLLGGAGFISKGNMIIKTEFSTYELNEAEKLIRRLEGQNPLPLNFGENGVFKKYNLTSLPRVGQDLVIVWNDPREPDWDGVIRTSRTSIIEEITK